MTAETLTATAGMILSLAFSYVPGLRNWYSALDGTTKRLVMLVVLTVTAVGFYALACTPYGQWLDISLRCDAAGFVGLLRLLLSAMIANQTAFVLTPRPNYHRELEESSSQALQLGEKLQ